MNGKVYLQNFIRHTLRNSGQSLAFAQRITGQKRAYTDRQIEEIVLNWLEANNYGNEEICQIIDLHIDKPYFDLYYELMEEKQRENDEIERLKEQKAKKHNATGKRLAIVLPNLRNFQFRRRSAVFHCCFWAVR